MRFLKSFEQYSPEYTKLDVSGYSLYDLEEYIPFSKNLKILWINDNNISTIPYLPDGLVELVCGDNKSLSKFPKFPNSLEKLYLPACKVKMLYELPYKLKVLSCGNNKLKSLPELPDTLEKLYCDDNELKYLPKLPDGLESLECSFNDWEEPIRYEYIKKFKLPLYELYSDDNKEEFVTFEFQKEFLEKNPSKYEDLIPFGYADGIKELFPHIFSAHDLGL